MPSMNCHNPNINNQLPLAKTTKADYSGNAQFDQVVVEEPLQLTLYWQDQSAVFTITMRTPGDDHALALGLLFSEGQIDDVNDIHTIHYDSNEHGEMPNQLQIYYKQGLKPNLCDMQRQLISQSSCGICGKTSLNTLELRNPKISDQQTAWIDREQLSALPDKLLEHQVLFKQCGGTHGAALFDNQYRLIDCKEDIGRHNAVDKIIGESLLRDEAREQLILVVSGRVSFELVQKAITAGYPVLVAVGAPSSLAINAAKRFNLTLVGFTSPGRFNVYCGQWRLKMNRD